jgi:hypothetical protein
VTHGKVKRIHAVGRGYSPVLRKWSGAIAETIPLAALTRVGFSLPLPPGEGEKAAAAGQLMQGTHLCQPSRPCLSAMTSVSP